MNEYWLLTYSWVADGNRNFDYYAHSGTIVEWIKMTLKHDEDYIT